MKKQGKLVRDNIPHIIKADDAVPVTRSLNKKEYKKALLDKLVEEAKEVTQTKNKKGLVDELADVYEVLEAITKTYGLSKKDVSERQKVKRRERGAFTKQILLKKIK